MSAAMVPDGGPGAVLGDDRGPSRSDLRHAGRALREGWNVSPALRQAILDGTEKILADLSDKRWIAAAKIVLLADGLNVRREATDSTEALAHLQASAAALRAALSCPEILHALARLTATPTTLH